MIWELLLGERMWNMRSNKKHGVYIEKLTPASHVSGGAEEFEFEQFQELPLYNVSGPGERAGQLNVYAAGYFVPHPAATPFSYQNQFETPNAVEGAIEPPYDLGAL